MSVLRRVRGVLGMAGTWAVVFGGLGAAIAGISRVLGLMPASVFGMDEIALIGLRWGMAGAVAGALFAGIVIRGAANQTLASLSPRRFARWGFIAGACAPLFGVSLALTQVPASVLANPTIWIGLATSTVVVGLLGRSTALATLRVARRGLRQSGDEPARLEAN